MTADELKRLYQRKAHALRARPGFGRANATLTARLREGFACEVDCGGETRLLADQPDSEGGGGAGPTPGQLMRAGVASCLAIGYKLWSARLDIPIDDVAVEMTCELDARGQMGLDPDVPPGFQKISYTVRIVSEAPEQNVRRLVETADRLSPMLASFSPAAERVRTIEIQRRRA
jgi:uncharacterized OsmC-like protein